MDYNINYLDKVEILSFSQKKALQDISNGYELKHLFAQRNMEDISIDFAYSNAKIEGCSYTYQEAETLLLTGRTAHNKSFNDAQMLINLKNTYIFIIQNRDNMLLNTLNIKNIHKLLMKNLLQDYELGNIRQIPVRIGGSTYIPQNDKNILNESLNKIVETANSYDDAFEKSIYIHNNLAYLQYFTDGNKRLSRVMQASILLNNQKMPFFYLDNQIDDYKTSLINYYETGSYKQYADFFINNYQYSLDKVVKFLKIR